MSNRRRPRRTVRLDWPIPQVRPTMADLVEENRRALDRCTTEPWCPASIHYPWCWVGR